MILKIKGRDSEKDWWFFSDIATIHYDETDYGDSCLEDWDWTILRDLGHQGNRSSEDVVLVAHISNKDGGGYAIRFDTAGYLCDDAGNTVDVIHITPIEVVRTPGPKA
jgi:hypothetical protein